MLRDIETQTLHSLKNREHIYEQMIEKHIVIVDGAMNRKTPPFPAHQVSAQSIKVRAVCVCVCGA